MLTFRERVYIHTTIHMHRWCALHAKKNFVSAISRHIVVCLFSNSLAVLLLCCEIIFFFFVPVSFWFCCCLRRRNITFRYFSHFKKHCIFSTLLEFFVVIFFRFTLFYSFFSFKRIVFSGQ